MGVIYSALCSNCKKLYNFDVGIGSAYNKNLLLNINSEFNLTTLFKEKNRQQELINILKDGNVTLDDDYGHKICMCDTCGGLNSRFMFNLTQEDGTRFSPKYVCHTCRKKLRVLTDDEIINEKFICPVCKNEIKFSMSGKWN